MPFQDLMSKFILRSLLQWVGETPSPNPSPLAHTAPRSSCLRHLAPPLKNAGFATDGKTKYDLREFYYNDGFVNK